jgi:hypothetical protein
MIFAIAALLIGLVVLAMVWGKGWLDWPLEWKFATVAPVLALFGWLAWSVKYG